ncbi:hypothetical protein MKW92_032203 [Papaver armeniacum]|nr:hypothetical protein MKW92_032203 [Papaver armeniacum]
MKGCIEGLLQKKGSWCYSGGRGRPAGAPAGLFGPNDWACAIEGRAGGYKELDEEEIEETRCRRTEAEQDDGELYDEFGNLKKFRAKTQEAEAGQVLPGAGRAGWEVEELDPPVLKVCHMA